jgi:DNA-binding NtrC family response regulator
MQPIPDVLATQIQNGPRRLWAICRAAERAEIARALLEHGHNRTHTAHALGISRRTLINKIRDYSLTRAACRHFGAAAPVFGPARQQEAAA